MQSCLCQTMLQSSTKLLLVAWFTYDWLGIQFIATGEKKRNETTNRIGNRRFWQMNTSYKKSSSQKVCFAN